MSSAAVTKKENAPANSMRPTREDGTKADEQRYQSELDRIKQNERKCFFLLIQNLYFSSHETSLRSQDQS